jgi:hypothetical protein
MPRSRLGVSVAAALAGLAWAQPSFAGDAICGLAALATIDGIPSYGMCSAAMNSDVWSDNGVDTAGNSGGASWTMTEPQNGYQCTELAARYFAFKWSIAPTWIDGDASGMCSQPLPSTITMSATGGHGDLLVVKPGCDGADPTVGHVAVVDSISGATVSVVQQNATYNGVSVGTGTFDASCALCFLHAVANDGTVSPDAGVADASSPTEPFDAQTPSNDAAPSNPIEPTPAADAGAVGAPVATLDSGPAPSSSDNASQTPSTAGFDSLDTSGSGCSVVSGERASGTGGAGGLVFAVVAFATGRRRGRGRR